jgi:hypothetical protein
MAKQQPVARKQSRSKQEADAGKQSRSKRATDADKGQNGVDKEVAKYEKELAAYLQQRIKPGLNSGAIPLLARSIAKDIAHREHPNGGSAEGGAQPSAEADDQPTAESEPAPDFEADMHDLQAELGEDWILRFSVQGDAGWLTAEKADGSQRVEAPTAAVIAEAVGLINEGGGRTS